MSSAAASRERSDGRGSRQPTRQRHDQIVTTAARLFARHGFSGVGIDDIGAELGLSGPALYRHIEGKEPLLAEIIIGLVDDLAEVSGRCVAGVSVTGVSGSAGALRNLISAVADRGLDRSAEITVTLRSGWYVSAESAADVLAHWDRVTGIWVPVIGQAHPDLDVADSGLYLRAAGGLLTGMAQGGAAVPRTRLVEMITGMTSAMLGTSLTARPAAEPPASDGGHVTAWARSSRREQILDAALALFRERGFRGVSMREIGGAVGISGSAAYRHFASKEDILATAIARVGERVTAGLTDALSAATSADDALDRLLRSYIAINVRNHDLIAVAASEAHYLSQEQRERRRANQRLFRSEWTHCLSSVRPDLSPAEAKALVSGIVGLVVEAARSRRMERRSDLAEELHRLAHAVIYAPRTSPARSATPLT